MTVQVILEKEEIKKVISQVFNVNQTKVDLELFMTSVGYGPGEHDEPCVRAVVEFESASFPKPVIPDPVP